MNNLDIFKDEKGNAKKNNKKNKQSRHPPGSNPGLPGLRRVAQPTELHARMFRLGNIILLNEHYIAYKHN